MSMFNNSKIAGSFQEKEHGKYFDYRYSQNWWGRSHGFDYEIAVGIDTALCAKILKTVAYVVIDEDEWGSPIVEKWDIKKHYIIN